MDRLKWREKVIYKVKKVIYNVTNYWYFKQTLHLNFLLIKKILEHFSCLAQKRQAVVLNIDKTFFWAPNQHIKNNLTLKTGVMNAENSAVIT